MAQYALLSTIWNFPCQTYDRVRAITYFDIIQTARFLRYLPREKWGEEALRGLYKAHSADLYRKRLGRVHPSWGNGTLAAAFAGKMSSESFLNGVCDLDAMAEVIHAVWSWRYQQNMKSQPSPFRFELECLSGKMRQA